MDKVLTSYGMKVYLKSGKNLDIIAVYDGVEFPFYYCAKEDGTRYSFLLDAIDYMEFSPERADQIEERKQEQSSNNEGSAQC